MELPSGENCSLPILVPKALFDSLRTRHIPSLCHPMRPAQVLRYSKAKSVLIFKLLSSLRLKNLYSLSERPVGQNFGILKTLILYCYLIMRGEKFLIKREVIIYNWVYLSNPIGSPLYPIDNEHRIIFKGLTALMTLIADFRESLGCIQNPKNTSSSLTMASRVLSVTHHDAFTKKISIKSFILRSFISRVSFVIFIYWS